MDKLKNDIKSYLKNRDMTAVTVLRSILTKVQNCTINAGKEYSEKDFIKCVELELKELNQSYDSYSKKDNGTGIYKDVLTNLDKMINIVKQYLPETLSQDEIITSCIELYNNYKDTKDVNKLTSILVNDIKSNTIKLIDRKMLYETVKDWVSQQQHHS
jgi:uncharacterized protein YqeY